MLSTSSKRLVVSILTAIILTSPVIAASIIPQPNSIQRPAGTGFTLTRATKIMYDSPQAKQPAQMLADYLRPATGVFIMCMPPLSTKKRYGQINFGDTGSGTRRCLFYRTARSFCSCKPACISYLLLSG